MKMKKIFALLLSSMLIVSTALMPLSASAESSDNEGGAGADTSTGINVEGSNSFGDLLADQFQDAMSDSDAEVSEYVVTDVVVNGNVATVSYSAKENCTVVVAVYDENSGEMLASGNADVLAEEAQVDVTIDTDSMPKYFALKAFMIDGKNYPLSENYATGVYTEAIQYVKNMSASDFESDRILNLDESEETNFAVFSDGTKLIRYTEGYNVPENKKPENGVYVFKNANDDFKSLSVGDSVSYEYDGEVILIKIGDISVDGDTVTITQADDLEIENFFDYVKIEETAKTEDVEYDGTGADEAVTYNGLINANDQQVKGIHSSGVNDVAENKNELSFTIGKNEGEVGSASTSVSATIKLSLEFNTEFYYNTYVNPVKTIKELKNAELKFDMDTSISIEGEAKIEGNFLEFDLGRLTFRPCVAIEIQLAPTFKISGSAKLAFSAGIAKRVGFNFSLGEGLSNTSTPVRPQFSAELEGTLFIGVDFGPKISLVCEQLLKVEPKIECGLETTASLTASNEEEDPDAPEHLCKACISGKIYEVLTFGVSVTVLDCDKLSVGKDFSFKREFSDYYWSLDFADGGLCTCPHYKERQTHKNEKSELIASGNCGSKSPSGKPSKDIKWELYSSGTVYIYGMGEMYEDAFVDECTYTAPSFSSDVVYNVDVIIEPGVTSIGKDAFISGSWQTVKLKLISVKIPSSVKRIGDSAFRNCDKLTSVKIPSGVKKIGSFAFEGCTSLKNITIPNSVTDIWTAAFSGCTSLTSIVIPNSVTEISQNLFANCTNLKSVTIPDTVTSMRAGGAFEYCASLKNITIPDSVTEIGSYTFLGCTGLTSITIPDGVTKIGTRAFEGCTSLANVIIPNSVTFISSEVFLGCTALTDVTISDSVTRISYGTFYGCEGLTSVKIPNSVTNIECGAFEGCASLKSIIIPESVAEIKCNAFVGCSKLSKIYFCGDKPIFSYFWKHVLAFDGVTATAYYIPERGGWENIKETWNGGGNMTFVPYSSSSIPNDGPIMKPSGTQLSDSKPSTVTKKFSGLVPGEQYIFMVVRSENAERLVASENLVYINQFTADENGKVKAEYATSADGDFATLIFGVGADDVQIDTPDTPDKPIQDSDTDTTTDTETDVETDTVTDTETTTDTETDVETDTATDTETTTDTETDVETDTATDTETTTDTETDVETDTATDTETTTDTETDVETDTATDTETTTDTETDVETDTATDTETTTDTETDVETDTATDTETDVETDTATDTETTTDTETDVETDTATDTETTTDTETDVETDTDSETDSDSDTDTEGEKVLAGDINGDGRVTVVDSLLAQRIMMKILPMSDELLFICDADGDRRITVTDCIEIQRVAVGYSTESNIGKWLSVK